MVLPQMIAHSAFRDPPIQGRSVICRHCGDVVPKARRELVPKARRELVPKARRDARA